MPARGSLGCRARFLHVISKRLISQCPSLPCRNCPGT
jgi:hypothetical protein